MDRLLWYFSTSNYFLHSVKVKQLNAVLLKGGGACGRDACRRAGVHVGGREGGRGRRMWEGGRGIDSRLNCKQEFDLQKINVI